MPYLLFVDLLVLFLFIFALVLAETKVRLYLLAVMALLFIFPFLFKTTAIKLICFTGRVIFGIGCYVYVKMHGYLS